MTIKLNDVISFYVSGRVWHPKLGSTTLIRRRQLEIAETEEGFKLALEWIKNKFNNQIDFLKRLRTTRPHKSAEITAFIEKLQQIAAGLNNLSGTLDECRASIMGIEGAGGGKQINHNFVSPNAIVLNKVKN